MVPLKSKLPNKLLVISRILQSCRLPSSRLRIWKKKRAVVMAAVQTFIFVLLFLRLSPADVPKATGALFIGLAYSVSHFATFAISGTSLNPARSTATALFAEGWAIDQLWLFWLAPLIGALIAGFAYGRLFGSETD